MGKQKKKWGQPEPEEPKHYMDSFDGLVKGDRRDGYVVLGVNSLHVVAEKDGGLYQWQRTTGGKILVKRWDENSPDLWVTETNPVIPHFIQRHLDH